MRTTRHKFYLTAGVVLFTSLFMASVASAQLHPCFYNRGCSGSDFVEDVVSFTVVDSTPADAIDDVIDQVDDLQNSGDLNDGQSNSLISKL